MKILLATYWYIPHLGGVWPLMCQIKERLEQLGHEVDILGNCSDGSGYHIVNKNLVIKKEELIPLIKKNFNLNADKRTLDIEIDRCCMELAAAYFGMNQYDIIHTQDVISTWCLSRVKPKNTPLIASIHGVLAKEVYHYFRHNNPNISIEEIQQNMYWKHYWMLDRFGTQNADLVHISSQWTRKIFTDEYEVPQEKIATFQYGININEFIEKLNSPTSIQKPVNKKLILYTGRLVDLKGLHYLLPALAKLKQHRQDWVCWVAGEGPMKNDLMKQASRLNVLDHVQFLGPRDDVPQLLKLADIFVLPSLQDNMPISLIEAQLAGKAIITSDAGGLPGMTRDGVTGFITPAGESDPMFFQLKNLLDNDALRQALSQKVQVWALDYWNIDLMVERLLHHYENLRKQKGN